MSKQVIWTDKVLGDFIILANLNDFQARLMRDRCKDVTVIEMSHLYHCSESKIHKEIARIRKIYDVVQAEYPDRFPIRKKSAKELYMDTH